MRKRVQDFLRIERGQDLVEYSLILAFVCLSGAALYMSMAQTTKGMWVTMNSRLANANNAGS